MNTYLCSGGSRVSQSVIDARMRVAKRKLIEDFKIEHGYPFCQKCKRSSGVRFDCSHVISIQDAKNIGQTELCWSVDNIKLLCRECHQKLDKLNLQYTG